MSLLWSALRFIGDEAGQFIEPVGIAVGEGEVFVSCDHRVQVFR